MKVGIVGYRNYNNYVEFSQIVNSLLVKLGLNVSNITVISGGADGADALADRFAKEHKDAGCGFNVHEALWDVHGLAAGPIRNQLIVNDSDILVAFVSKKSRGTYITIGQAKKKGIPVYEYQID